MADTYLPADVRKRIVDVMRERKMTQRELALRIDVNESTISRFLSGKTEKLSEESVIRIARVFNVSTDFILGTTVIPDKKNYDISELGLSVEAAKNLYTGKVNNDVVNRLLENPRFAMVTYMIAQYMDDTLARGNELFYPDASEQEKQVQHFMGKFLACTEDERQIILKTLDYMAEQFISRRYKSSDPQNYE